jgi:ubiquinone/menaquinone biosynthesis C-methylase UbiE
MCVACQPPALNSAASDAFAERLVGVVNHAALALSISLGHRTGLLDAMDDGASRTTDQLAEQTGLSERYIREWLGAMVCGEVIELDDPTQTYRLPPEHAAWLTRAASPDNIAVTMQWIGLMGAVETPVAEAFRHGQGVPYEVYDRFVDVMAEESAQTTTAALTEHILPLVEGLVRRLEQGIDVLDLGCGRGGALLHLAQQYPNSRFVGYDLLDVHVRSATERAEQQGLTNVRFEQRDVTAMDDAEAFDLVMTFDAIHDQARPGVVLRNIRRSLRPGGVYLCQEIKAETGHAANRGHPLGTFVYTVSMMHCMSVSLAQGGEGLGAAWGRQLCEQHLREAGFDAVQMSELDHDIINDYWVCRV